MIPGLAVIKRRRSSQESDIIHIMSYPNNAPNSEGLYDFYKDHKIIKVRLDPDKSILDYVPNQPTGNGRAVPYMYTYNGYRLLGIKKLGENLSFLETCCNKTVIYQYLQFKTSKIENMRLFYIHSEKRFLMVTSTEEELNDIHYKLTISNKFKNYKDKIFILDTFRNKIEVEISDVKFFAEKELKRERNLSDDKEAFDLLVTQVLRTEIDEHFYNLYNFKL